MNQQEYTKHIFNCPVHGIECDRFCYRAFLEENADRWQEFVVEVEDIPEVQMIIITGESQ